MKDQVGTMLASEYAFGVEVHVDDANALFGDAASVLKLEGRSALVRAIDAKQAIALMSERAFHELGWMSAKAARGYGVDESALRELLERAYLPRISVVMVPQGNDSAWVPLADGVRDPDDVPHAQLARLVRARAVYSHDKHLRTPGYAPPTRKAYDTRVAHLQVVAARAETEHSVALTVGLAGGGVAEGVRAVSARLNVKVSRVWAAVLGAVVLASLIVLSSPERRRRIGAASSPLMDSIGDKLAVAECSRQELSLPIIVHRDEARLESRVATWLVRHPNSTRSEIREAWEQTSVSKIY